MNESNQSISGVPITDDFFFNLRVKYNGTDKRSLTVGAILVFFAQTYLLLVTFLSRKNRSFFEKIDLNETITQDGAGPHYEVKHNSIYLI